MTVQFNGIKLFTLDQARQHEPRLHARIVNISGNWLVLFGQKMAFTDDADLVAILYEQGHESPIAFDSKTAAADLLDPHAAAFASVSC
ncbi:hypothetical protein HQ393_12400 [Chitinibacter bivalviorum]|uniref:Uncharacterized protein n=1 Tax=Chitinibacter bivalviorum TaxID=2739434 RepID=A0A7H9BK76_9NEIS|nr:hypothetical protein [Chitinibacter bivalviorum]QLG88973.1 hypothetical protein HQ393_12400 [Chitinibacter bivalviorum]